MVRTFSDAWIELVAYARSHDSIETLSHGSENRLSYDASDHTILVDHDEPEPLHMADIERVWKTLEDDGALQRENTREALGKYRASVTLALLVRALDLPYESRPITVYPDRNQ